MEYYYSFQNWLYQTNLYQNILREMPAPFNNIYFETVLVLGLAVYVIYRIIETIRIACYHKRIRKQQAHERQSRWDREQEMLFREKQVQEKEERIGRFMDYMEFLFRSRMRRSDAPEQSETAGQRKRLGFRGLFLEKKDKLVADEMTNVSSTSDYDVVMENYAYDEQREEEISRKREKENEEVFSKLHTLDDELRVEAVSDNMEKAAGNGSDPEIEKRKERARKAEEKERKKGEKLFGKLGKMTVEEKGEFLKKVLILSKRMVDDMEGDSLSFNETAFVNELLYSNDIEAVKQGVEHAGQSIRDEEIRQELMRLLEKLTGAGENFLEKLLRKKVERTLFSYPPVYLEFQEKDYLKAERKAYYGETD